MATLDRTERGVNAIRPAWWTSLLGAVAPRFAQIALAVLAAAAIGGCGSGDSSPDAAARGTDAIEACNDHGGVTAFDDDAVICGDGTVREERGTDAVDACRGHDGVSAFDDDIVICSDQTFHRVEGG